MLHVDLETADLKEAISRYLEKKQSVWILFDNLDKGWSTSGVDVVDATVLRCLIDAGRKIEREMARAGHVFHCVVFIRNDVYEHLMRNSADYGKEMRATLDWTDTDLLKEMLRLRLVSGLDSRAAEMEFDVLWRTIFDPLVEGEDSADYIIARSLMRPRNVLKIVSHARGYATNLSHSKVLDDDIIKGLLTYSQDLIIELDRELVDLAPAAKDIIYFFIDSPPLLIKEQLGSILRSAGVAEDEVDGVVDFLLYYGVLGVHVQGRSYFVYDTNYDLKPIKIRALKAGDDCRYVINEAFWPALGIEALN